MCYIIIWKNSHKEPHIDIDSRGFKEEYMTYEDAKKSADEIIRSENENGKSPWYFDYQIYKSV